MRILVIIVCIIIVAALVLTYVMMFPLNASADSVPETPPPDNYGTSGDYDESTLTFPSDTTPTDDQEPVIPVLMITGGPISLDIGQTYQIPYVMNDFPEGTELTWETSNPNVAVISSDGIVYAVAPGDVEIAARAGQKRVSVLVTVNELKATGVTIVIDPSVVNTGPKAYQVTVGDVTDLTAQIEPTGAVVDKLTWVLGNSNVATLSSNGEFVATAAGQTQVTLSAGSLSDAIQINIIEGGVPMATIWDNLKYIIVIILVIVVIIVLVWFLIQRNKREKARQKAAAAKRRKEEAERRARAEAAAYDNRLEVPEQHMARTEERTTMRVSGAAVGAGIPAPDDQKTEIERPLTLDDLE